MTTLKISLDNLQKIAKERTVKTQNIEYDLETLVKKIDKEVIKLNPEYQRNHRWSDDVSSRLIESLILNIPVPLIYISQDVDVDEEIEEDTYRYSVIDGQQRLTAIHNFFKNKFSLTDLNVLSDLNGAFYRDLPPFLIRRLEERTIKCLRIDSTLDSQVKYDIFERLNSGSVKLEPQELRNATCRGPFRELTKELAINKDFVTIARLSPDGGRVKKMEDQELVLRYFALVYNDGYKEYKKRFKEFLTDKMKFFNTLNQTEINKMKIQFSGIMKAIRTQFGDEPFAKYRLEEDGQLNKVSSFNAAVFDAVMVSFSKIEPAKWGNISIDGFKKLFEDHEFFNSIEGSVNDSSKLLKRIEMTSGVIG